MFSQFKFILISACGTSLFFIFYLVANTSPNIVNFNVDQLKNGDLDLSLTYFNSSKSFDPKFLPILEELGFNERTNFVDLNGPLPPVTFITAASENHAPEARNLTLRLARDHPSWKIVIYDIGLEPETRKWFESEKQHFQAACNLDIRNINLTQYGVTLDSYRWKPIVIAVALIEFPAVVWIDTSTHVVPFITKDQMIIELDPQPNSKEPNHYIFSLNRHSTYAVTRIDDYLRPQRNVYKTQYEASKQLLIRTRSTYELSLKWWVLCALEKDCLTPEGHAIGCVFDQDRVATLAGCNRYDQSAINIILLPYSNSHVHWPVQGYMWTFRGHSSPEEPVVCSQEMTKESTVI